jgi:hypothetical protein
MIDSDEVHVKGIHYIPLSFQLFSGNKVQWRVETNFTGERITVELRKVCQCEYNVFDKNDDNSQTLLVIALSSMHSTITGAGMRILTTDEMNRKLVCFLRKRIMQ